MKMGGHDHLLEMFLCKGGGVGTHKVATLLRKEIQIFGTQFQAKGIIIYTVGKYCWELYYK